MGLFGYFFMLIGSGWSRLVRCGSVALLWLFSFSFSVVWASQAVISKEKEEIPANRRVEAEDRISADEKKFIESIDQEDAEVVARLSKGNRGNALAALKAGYKHIRLIGPHYLMVTMPKSDIKQGFEKRFQYLVSFKNERKYSRDGKNFEFSSVISDISYNCTDFSFKTYRQEYKSMNFGLGDSKLALVSTDTNPEPKTLKSGSVRKYFDEHVCK